MELNEIQIYKKRIEDEYRNLLTYRDGILKQIALDEQDLEGIERDKKTLIDEVNKDIEKEKIKLKKLEDGGKDFINNLNIREQNLTMKEQEVERQLEELGGKIKEYDKKTSQLEKLSHLTQEEKKKIEDEWKLIEYKKNQVDIQLKIIYRQVNDTRSENQISIKMREQLQIQQKQLELKEKELKLKEEEVHRQFESIQRQRKEIDKDRLYLFSQQATLRLAFQEAKKKGII